MIQFHFRRVQPIERKRVKVVRAGRAAAPITLTSWDQGPGHSFVRCAWFFEQRVDPERVRAGFEKALHHFPMLAGRLRSGPDHSLRVACDDRGASFCEAYEPHRFEPLGPDAPGSGRIDRYIEANSPFRMVDRDKPLASVQVTHLATGGSIVGVGVCHTVVDGDSYFRFANAIGRACRGEPIDGPSVSEPSWEPLVRTQVAHPEAVGIPHFPLFSIPRLIAAYARLMAAIPMIETAVLRFSRADIDALKAEASQAGVRCSTNDVVTAYAWRELRRLQGDASRAGDRMHMVVNVRGRVPEISPDYFGNAAFSVIIDTPENALAREPFAEVVRRVRGAVNGLRPIDFAESFCAFDRYVREGTRWRGLPLMLLDCFDGNAAFDSWAKFPMYEVDFGSGRPWWVFAPVMPVPRFSLILPSSEAGGVDVHVNLRRAEILRLQASWRRELNECARSANSVLDKGDGMPSERRVFSCPRVNRGICGKNESGDGS